MLKKILAILLLATCVNGSGNLYSMQLSENEQNLLISIVIHVDVEVLKVSGKYSKDQAQTFWGQHDYLYREEYCRFCHIVCNCLNDKTKEENDPVKATARSQLTTCLLINHLKKCSCGKRESIFS